MTLSIALVVAAALPASPQDSGGCGAPEFFTQTQRLGPIDSTFNQGFGLSRSLHGETLAVGAPASGDVAAMAAASEPQANRPWLEMLMRPLRAGTDHPDASHPDPRLIVMTGTPGPCAMLATSWRGVRSQRHRCHSVIGGATRS